MASPTEKFRLAFSIWRPSIRGQRVAQNRVGQSSLLTRFTNAHTLAQLHEVNHMVQDGDLRKAQAPGSSYKA